jgi:hypothetical protein
MVFLVSILSIEILTDVSPNQYALTATAATVKSKVAAVGNPAGREDGKGAALTGF